MIYLLENWKLLRAFLCPYFFLSTFLESLVVNLFFDGSDLIKGKFIVDMNTLTVDDIKGGGKES